MNLEEQVAQNSPQLLKSKTERELPSWWTQAGAQ